MADEGVAKGGCVDDHYAEESATKISVLQRERDELVGENVERKEEIKNLRAELNGLRSDGAHKSEKIKELQREVEQSLDAAIAMEFIAARAADRETEVGRLHHDVVSEMTLGEKESRVESLEKELAGLKAENEVRVRDLERKIGVLETKEIEERNKRFRFEEETRDKIDEKERKIKTYRQKVEELERVVVEKKTELDELDKQKLKLQNALRQSMDAIDLEWSILQSRLCKEAKEAEKAVETFYFDSIAAAFVASVVVLYLVRRF